jgi:hypothetical protein
MRQVAATAAAILICWTPLHSSWMQWLGDRRSCVLEISSVHRRYDTGYCGNLAPTTGQQWSRRCSQETADRNEPGANETVAIAEQFKKALLRTYLKIPVTNLIGTPACYSGALSIENVTYLWGIFYVDDQIFLYYSIRQPPIVN